jgi:nucleotide-binding universal stress UspA family protein
VLAAVDATPEDEDHGQLNTRILKLAADVCDTKDNLFVIYVWEVFGESIFKAKLPEEEFAALEVQFRERNESSFNAVLAQQGLTLESDHAFLEHGDPVIIIPQLVAEHKIDLLVMGTVARTGVPGLLMGNTAESLVEQIDCGLLTIKPADFGSPVSD